jgi:hypothetical protein
VLAVGVVPARRRDDGAAKDAQHFPNCDRDHAHLQVGVSGAVQGDGDRQVHAGEHRALQRYQGLQRITWPESMLERQRPGTIRTTDSPLAGTSELMTQVHSTWLTCDGTGQQATQASTPTIPVFP